MLGHGCPPPKRKQNMGGGGASLGVSARRALAGGTSLRRSSPPSQEPLPSLSPLHPGPCDGMALWQDAYVRVDPGDTLDTLAEAFQVPRSEFVACNRDLISSENLIYEGDLLRVPGEAWKGVAPPGLEGRIVLRTPGTLGDALATVGTALQLLPSYLGLGPGARLPAGTGGWLMLGGALMVALGAVGRLRRGAAAAESPTSAATLARVRGVRAAEEAEAEAVPWALLGSVKLKSYATPGLPPNMRGPYTGTFQNPDNLPNQLMQASILEADQKAPATEEAAKEALVLTPQPVLAAAAATTPASPAKEAPVDPPTPSAAASGTATAVKAEKEAAGETGKKAPTEHRKLRKEKEAPKHSPAAVPPLGLASAEKAVVAAAAPATSQSAPAPAAATAVPPPPAEAEAPAVPASGGWKFPSISFGKDSTTTIFRFGQDTSTPEASASAAEAATGPSTSASSASTDSSTSPSPGSSKSQAGAWGPYTLGWAGSQSEGGDGKQVSASAPPSLPLLLRWMVSHKNHPLEQQEPVQCTALSCLGRSDTASVKHLYNEILSPGALGA